MYILIRNVAEPKWIRFGRYVNSWWLIDSTQNVSWHCMSKSFKKHNKMELDIAITINSTSIHTLQNESALRNMRVDRSFFSYASAVLASVILLQTYPGCLQEDEEWQLAWRP